MALVYRIYRASINTPILLKHNTMNVEWLMFLGPLRISIFFFMIFLLYRIVSLKSSNQKGLNFLIPRYCLFLSLAVLVGFLLTLLNAYDLLMILLILFSTIFMIFMNFKKKNTLGKQLRKIYSRLILYTVIKVEKGETFIDSHNVNKQRTNDGYSRLSGLNRKWQFALAAVILGLIYSSRFFYAAYDNHTLSESWYNEIGLIKEISAQHWFFYTGSMMGDNLLINIYGKLAHVSDAIALQSSGLIEVSVLALVLYWVAFKITGNHGPGCIAALSFGFLYAFLPVNLNQLLQHKSIFLALTLAIPTMAFTIFPKALRLDQRVYLRWMFYFFCAIFLINLFVGLYIVPSFLVLAVIFNYKYRRVYVLRSLLAYSIALVTIGIIYSIASLIMKENLWDFFISNIFSFSSYTYAPQLIVPFDSLIYYYQAAAAVLLIISLIKYTVLQRKWTPIVVFMLYFNLLFNLYWLDEYFMDVDLFTQAVSVFLPLFFGLAYYIISALIPRLNLSVKFDTAVDVAIAAICIALIGFATIDHVRQMPIAGHTLQDQVFEAYIDIEESRLPYSYTVVNSNQNYILSKGSHYFLSYNLFNAEYLARDAHYNRFKKKPEYLREHTDAILPQSVLVFVYDQEVLKNKSNALDKNQQLLAIKQLEKLKKRGRKVDVIYKKPLLQVYEIVNEPHSSKINDLIF